MHVCYYSCTAMRYSRSAFRAFTGKKEGAGKAPPVLIFVLPISAVESCLELSLLIFVAGLAEKSEHVLLVSLNAGLVEGVDCEEITGDAACLLEEVDELT